MPVPPSISKTIGAIRNFMDSGAGRKGADLNFYLLIDQLFRKPAWIVGDLDTLDAVLALAPEIDAYRGKGSQIAAREFHQRLTGLIFHARENFSGQENPDEARAWFDKLSAHFFPRVQGPPVRSQHAGRLRAVAWFALGELSSIDPQPEHLAHALKVAADPRGADVEREGAIQFLATYWSGNDPDPATADLLDALAKNPANREFLVTVLQTQIELGLNDEFGALCAVDDWDDAEEEE